jgi:hypothetical protein
MTALLSPFRDEGLDADLTSILGLDNERTRRQFALPSKRLANFWERLLLSRQASVTMACAITFALLASAALLLSDHTPATRSSVEVVPLPDRPSVRPVANFTDGAEAKESEVVKATVVDQNSVLFHKPKYVPRRSFTSNTVDKIAQRGGTTLTATTAEVSRSENAEITVHRATSQFPNQSLANKKSALPASTISDQISKDNNSLDILERSDFLTGFNKSRRESVDAMRFLRRQ